MQFEPKFPRTVAGAEWRTPLDHPELEEIAKRADHLYRNFSLSEEHRTLMLVQYAHLAEADKLIENLRSIMGKISLADDPGIRPTKPVKTGVGSNTEVININVGFALRLAEWVQKLEDQYGVTAWRRFGQIHDRDGDDDDGASVGRPVLAEEDRIPPAGEDF